MSAASGPVSPKNSDGRSSSGSSPCGKRSVRSPRSRRSMRMSGSGPNPRLSSRRKWGYLALGATKGGEDAALTPWQPVPEWGKEMYESRLKMIGGVTGIGFITNDLKRTVADLKKKGTKTAVDGESQTFGRFTD